MKVIRPQLLLCVMALVVAVPNCGIAEETKKVAKHARLLAKLSSTDSKVVTETLDDLQFAPPNRKLLVKARLVQLLESESAEIRKSVLEILGKIGPASRDILPAVQSRLTDPDLDVRIEACQAVWDISQRADRVVPVLLKLLKSKKERDVYNAGLVLETIGSGCHDFIDPISTLTKDKSSDVRFYAFRALGELGPTYRVKVEPIILNALNDSDVDIRIAGAQALARIDAPLDRAVVFLKKMVTPNPKTDDPDAVRQIFPSATTAGQAVEALGDLEGDAVGAIDELIDALGSKYLSIRLAATEALGKLGPSASKAIPALSKSMRETKAHSYPFGHTSWCVGVNAADALALIGEAAIPALVEASQDKDGTIRINATRALGQITNANEQRIGPLNKRLTDAHPLVRIEAAKGIRRLGKDGHVAVPNLVRLLADDLAFTSFRAGSGIGHTESVRNEAMLALLAIRPSKEQVVPAIVAVLQKENINANFIDVASKQKTTNITFEFIVALREFGDKKRIPKLPLERLLKNPKTQVTAAAALAILDPDHEGLSSIFERSLC